MTQLTLPTDLEWLADSYVHVVKLGVAETAKRLGLSKTQVFEKLEAVTKFQEARYAAQFSRKNFQCENMAEYTN